MTTIKTNKKQRNHPKRNIPVRKKYKAYTNVIPIFLVNNLHFFSLRGIIKYGCFGEMPQCTISDV